MYLSLIHIYYTSFIDVVYIKVQNNKIELCVFENSALWAAAAEEPHMWKHSDSYVKLVTSESIILYICCELKKI